MGAGWHRSLPSVFRPTASAEQVMPPRPALSSSRQIEGLQPMTPNIQKPLPAKRPAEE